MNPYKDVEDSSFTSSPHLAYEDIATKLLKDHYFLTALELHTELVESGKELPQLREFFSNPGNFEQHVSRPSDIGSMHRTPSQATLDSLDTARYSEDGGGDRGGSGGDVAVLEFELRKARETINALRANLTQFADGESALDKITQDNFDKRSLKPHEKRALNFLINEYLLLQNYKLTSITFSDENPDQEFEDWDDVGLNMPRPAGLISLFRGNKSSLSTSTNDAVTQTDGIQRVEIHCQTECEEENVCVSCQTSLDNDTDWNHELLIQAEEIELLKQKIIALETEKLNFQKLYDAAIVSLNSLTSPTSECKGLDLQIPGDNKKDGSNTSSFEPAMLGEISARGSPLRTGSVTTLDETLSINDAGDWTRVQYEYNIENNTKEMWIDSGIPTGVKESILNLCSEALNLNEPLTNDLLAELVNSDKPITLPGLLLLVADTLPRIVPHTLVSRRCEAAALLAAGAALLSAAEARRARLLHTLLTLLKKPEPGDARIICEAVCLVVKWGGAAEVLSSVAELLASRSSERRILASQICLAIAPYVPVELCTSLLLSLVALMCESSEPEVRSLGLKSACLVCVVADHKYNQLENLMFSFLKDPVDKNVKDTINVFVPTLARSALMAGKFSSDLCNRVMTNLIKSCNDNEWKNVLLNLEVIKSLVLAKLAYVINVQIVKDVNLSDCDMKTINLQDVPLESENFIDVSCYVSDSVDAKTLLLAMNSLIKDPSIRWTELDWFIDWIRKMLEIISSCKVSNHPMVYELLITLFNSYIDNFGYNFACNIMKPIFTDILNELEHKIEKLDTVSLESTVVVGIYLASVLIAVEEGPSQAEFLQKWIVYSSIRGLPAKIFSMPFKWLATHRPEVLTFFWQHLREFCASSCENASGAGIRAHIAALLTEMVNVSDVREECMERQLLPAVIALLYDDHVSVREAALSSWGSVTRACMVRGLSCGAQCWPPMEQWVGGRTLTPREAARLAEALALLVLPTVDDRAVSEQVTWCEAREISRSLELSVQETRRKCRNRSDESIQIINRGVTERCGESHELRGVTRARVRESRRELAATTNLQAAQEVGRRVTQIFHHSKNNINLQNIFKKKT
ncbi:LisH domain and HEAT repeat-containing protein KIAA1468-like [Papilio machaon]|uniref:LisH domain and HEAT repeat-containing protein KIAA1468-like n=1 Tax=Papilio machaon TaxID=76193 RepID=A0A194QPH0_PAPMA|nr:LisH domain and HEAT repeat-containing protein KIAA1468-like [Papilio machaon]